MRGDSLGAGAADKQFLDAIQVSSISTDTGLAALALGAVALGLALKGQSSSPGLSTTSAPTILEAAVPVPPPVEGEKPADVLKPGGRNVGEPGENSGVRVLPGSENEARELFDRLTKGGRDITPPGHIGKVIRMPDGSVISYRPRSKSGPPTIDVNVPGLKIRKLKFPGRERLMRTLTDRERRSLVEEFHAESEGDLVGLWEIAKEVEELIGTGETAREQSLMVVRDLLAKGLIAGDPPYRPGGYKVWDDQVPNNVVARIRIEWLSLGHTPNIPDIVWFGRRE